MKKALLILILWLYLTLPASAQEQVHFPILYGNPCGVVADMGDWKVIVQSTSPVTNKVLNPSGETTGNFAALAGTTVTRDTSVQHYGLYSYRVQSNADNEGITFDLEALANTDHWVTMRVSGTLPAAWDWSVDDTNYHVPTLVETIDSSWKLYALAVPAAQASGQLVLYVRQNGTGTGDYWLDGVQVEAEIDVTYTTYCDGTQDGCEWNGAPHASSSTRSPNSRAGGVVYDLEDDYGLRIGGMSGSGTSPQELFVDSYSQLPGGELNAIKTNSRIITLSGVITGTSMANFHQKKQDLKSILAKDAVPQDQNGFQPIRLRYTGATVHKEIQVHYEGGLEGEIVATQPCFWENVAVRFIAPNPYWYEIGESAALLDTNDSATFQAVAARLRSTSQWDALGPPHASGTYNNVRAIIENDLYIYMAGDFLNFNNIANADYIVRYEKATGTYAALDVGANAIIYALALSPTGILYAGGSFTSIGGVVTNAIAYWDGAAWNAMGSANSTVFALTYGPDGLLYAGGQFTTIGGGGANRIASWNGSAWSALGVGTDDIVQALVFGGSLLYVGGRFTTAGGVAAGGAASWDGSAWSSLGVGVDDIIYSLAYSPNGLLYAGGDFVTADGAAALNLAVWNGNVWGPLGGGADNVVRKLALGPDGVLYLGGVFSSVSGLTTTDSIARWNGYAFSHLDINLPGSATVFALMVSKYVDPVVPQKYNLYVGFNTTGTGTFAGLETIANGGTVPAFPKIIFNRSGGTTATIQTVRNERNGQEILFNYALLDGETLTVDLAQTKKSISSSFFGSRQDAVLPNSDFGNWQLLPGNNDITSFVSTSGSPTITAWVLYKDTYDSQD